LRSLLPFFFAQGPSTREEIAQWMRPRGLRPIFWPAEQNSHRVQIGDAMLWRRPGLISWGGNGQHSHAGLVDIGIDTHEYECLEIREFHGGRRTPLIWQVWQYPGRIDVFSPPLDLMGRIRAATEMRKFVGVDYGWYSVVRAGMRHLPFVRWAIPGSVNDDMVRGWPPFCSEGLSEAYRLGPKLDPVKRRADCYTEPSDFASVFEYQGTLVPSF